MPAGQRRRGACRGRERPRRPARLGGLEPAAPGPGDDALRRPAATRHGQAGRGPEPRARQDPARRARRRAARARGGRVLHRRAAHAEGRIHRGRRAGDRHVFDAPAGRRRRRDHALQLPRDDPDVEVLPGSGLWQRLHPQALRARPLGAADAGRADAGGGRAGRHPERGQRPPTASGRSASGAPRTT